MKTFLIAVLILVSAILAKSQNAEEFSDMAEAKYEQEDYQYAMVLIEKAIALNDTDQWYYLKKAKIQLKLSGPLDAIKIVDQAILINNKNPEPYNRAGTFYESAGMSDSALAMYNLAIHYSANDTVKHTYIMNRGTAKAGMRDFEGAAKDFETVLEFDPKNIGALNNIAPTYRHLGKVDKSIASLKKIISIDSIFTGTYINLGFIYSKLDSLDLAIEYFDKAIALDPKEGVTYNNRGHTYYQKGNYSKALEDINLSISLYPTNSYAYRNLALVYIAMNSFDEACTVLEYAERYGFEKRYGSEVFELMNKYCMKEAGKRMYSKDWDRQSKTNKRLLPKYGLQSRTEEEKQADQKFINEVMEQEQFKGDKSAVSDHFIHLGFTYMNKGDLKTAMYRFNQAYLLDSTNTDIYWGYGAIYQTLGKFESVREQYEEGLSHDSANTHILIGYSSYFMVHFIALQTMSENDNIKNPIEKSWKYLDSALIYLNKAYQIDPKDQNTTFTLSTMYWFANDCKNAWKYYYECKALGGQPITEDYKKDLRKKCKNKK